MPRYDFHCNACGTFEHEAHTDTYKLSCKCGRMADRQFTTSVQFCVPAHMTAANSSGQSAHKEWANSPEVKRKRDLGLIASEKDADLVAKQIAPEQKTETADEIYQKLVTGEMQLPS